MPFVATSQKRKTSLTKIKAVIFSFWPSSCNTLDHGIFSELWMGITPMTPPSGNAMRTLESAFSGSKANLQHGQEAQPSDEIFSTLFAPASVHNFSLFARRRRMHSSNHPWKHRPARKQWRHGYSTTQKLYPFVMVKSKSSRQTGQRGGTFKLSRNSAATWKATEIWKSPSQLKGHITESIFCKRSRCCASSRPLAFSRPNAAAWCGYPSLAVACISTERSI